MSSGTLADQITYPAVLQPAQRTLEVEARLAELLELVRLSYLLERFAGDGGWDVRRVWEDTLSLGEQQRIGMARLFYQKPRFAVLDECTSAVSIDVETALYKSARDEGIVCITLSQRLALQEFHAQELKLGVASQDGWELLKI